LRFGDIIVDKVFNQNNVLKIERNPYCLSIDDYINESYFVTSRTIRYGSKNYVYFSLDIYSYSNRHYEFPLKLFGIYDKKKYTLIPLYFVDKKSNDIILLLDYIGLYQLRDNSFDRVIETFHGYMIKEIMNMFAKDRKVINKLINYFCDEIITNKLMPLSLEKNISLQYDLIVDFIYSDSFLSTNISEYLNRILLYENFYNTENYLFPTLARLHNLYVTDRWRIFDLLKMSKKNNLVSYGDISFQLDKKIINISKISNDLYNELIKFIINFIEYDFVKIYIKDTFEIEGIITNCRFNDQFNELSENSLIIKTILRMLHINENIESVVKLNSFSLLFISKNHIYHINLMIIPLATFLID
jgi:hypothetical protein